MNFLTSEYLYLKYPTVHKTTTESIACMLLAFWSSSLCYVTQSYVQCPSSPQINRIAPQVLLTWLKHLDDVMQFRMGWKATTSVWQIDLIVLWDFLNRRTLSLSCVSKSINALTLPDYSTRIWNRFCGRRNLTRTRKMAPLWRWYISEDREATWS